MLSEKPWKPEAALMLLAGLMVSLFLGTLGGLMLQQFATELSIADRQFCSFVIGSVTMQGMALYLTHRFLGEHAISWKEFLGLRSLRLGKGLLLALAAGVIVLPFAQGLSVISKMLITALEMKPVEQPPMRVLEISVSLGQRIWFGISAIVLAPVAEEILFRGILYPLIKQRGYPQLALWFSALLFALIHVNLMVFVPLTFLALVLTFVYEKTDALIAPILTHSFFNAANFIIFINHQELTGWCLPYLQGPGHLSPVS